MNGNFLPVTKEDMASRGWDELDIILISGDAYVDHPSYGVSVIGRVLEKSGYRVGIIAQPDWRSSDDFIRLGRPRLFFGITAGNVDSMIANYTANKRPRKADDYSPGGKAGMRPDRAVIVYANRVREAYKDVPIVIGGIESSLRRLAHYDYWDDCVRRSILIDSRADVLVYGMGEQQVVEIARRLDRGEPAPSLNGIRGTAVVRPAPDFLHDYISLPAFEQVSADKDEFCRAFVIISGNMNPFTARPLAQQHGDRFVIQFPPALPLSEKELDDIYDLPYARGWHSSYAGDGGVHGFETVKFSLISHRGCCGECSFCALYFHQGKIVQSRSIQSIVKEAETIAAMPDFRGTITDIGGPTANMYGIRCRRWDDKGFCDRKQCLAPEICSELELNCDRCLDLYRRVGQVPNIKHVFIGSGFRHDLLLHRDAKEYFTEVCRNHISGLIKVAPEHCCDDVLGLMHKPPFAVYEQFVKEFKQTAREVDKDIYIVNYFLSSHPGCSLNEALELGLYLARRGIKPEQIQDFIPSPMTLATCMYYAGIDPFSGKQVYVPRTFRERKMQRALIQYQNPASKKFIVEALRQLGAMHVLRKFEAAARGGRPSNKRKHTRKVTLNDL